MDIEILVLLILIATHLVAFAIGWNVAQLSDRKDREV